MVGENENVEGEGKETNEQKSAEFVSKEQYEQLAAQLNELKEEVVSPEYLEFLATGKRAEAPAPKANVTPDDDLEKLSKKELVELIAKQTKDLVESTLKGKELEAQKAEQARIADEVMEFSKTHADFTTYRPIMYGLSLDPKYSRCSLNQLYDAAKAHIESLKKGDTEEDKKRKSVISGERPGNASASFQKADKGKSPEQLNAEALAETKAKLGAIPIE